MIVSCSVCASAFDRPDRGRGRLRRYCSVACRQRAYRDRCDGRVRLFPDLDRPPPMVRPGLRRNAPGDYATRDGGIRFRREGRGWTVYVVVTAGHVYPEGNYPTLRDARREVGVDVR